MDYAALFHAVPTPYLVMTPDLVIAEANDAYLSVVGRSREELIGRPVFQAFPPTPDALDASGVSRVQLSFEKARDTGEPDTMPVQKYDIADPATGELGERYWSLISVPVLDRDGVTRLLLQRAEDITEYVRERDRSEAERTQGTRWQRRAEEVEADLFARSQELEAAVRRAEVASRQLAALAEVALQLTSAQSVEDLTTIVIERGFSALGADGGGIGVVGPDGVLHSVLTDSLGEQARTEASAVPLEAPLPACDSARTGQRILLRDRESSCGYSSEMAGAVESTGCVAWASLPLRSAAQLLGSLNVGWREPQQFTSGELELLDALAAQCGQALERIQQRQAEQRSVAAAHRMSETLQRSLLTDPPQPPGLQIAVRYRPAAREAQVGGDWYDAFLASDHIPCVVIGDVSGHDRDAAAAMGQVRNLLRGIAYTLAEPPAAVFQALDRALEGLAVGSLATAVLARLIPAADGGRLLRWSNAGHPPPLLLSPDGTAELLRTPADLLLGLDAGTDRADHERMLPPGATVLLYTDGLVERRGSHLDDGLAHLAAVAADLAGLELEELCDALLGRLGQSGDDDVALLAVRLHGR